MSLEHVGNALQHLIAGIVAVTIVERLEMIEVEQDEAHREAVPLSPREPNSAISAIVAPRSSLPEAESGL
ncbi:MAG TPA: hypothetical protein VFN79_09230 [Steroidobacteraceae bacterium]|nr:hypothetical protein [Steroidobacteraceae bacterium]